jgi:uncharacterized membrane protein YhaH (DUF805 family)
MAKKNQFLIDGLFGFDGRFRRSEYWIASIGLALVRLVALGLCTVILGVSWTQASKIFPIRIGLDLLFLWPYAAITIKRGHDRNRSARYTGGLLALMYGISWSGSWLLQAGDAMLGAMLGLALLPIALYILIDYGFIDGTKGPNRYGASDKYPETHGERLVLGEAALPSEPPKA